MPTIAPETAIFQFGNSPCAAFLDYYATDHDSEEVAYSFKSVSTYSVWLVAYQVFSICATRKIGELEPMINTKFFTHLPIPPQEWSRGFEHALASFPTFIEDRPGALKYIALTLKSLCGEAFPFKLEDYRETLQDILPDSEFDKFCAHF